MDLRSTELGLEPVAAASGGMAASSSPLQRLDRAVNTLRRERPELSASAALSLGQRTAIAAGAAAIITGAISASYGVRELLLSFLTLPFFCVASIRLIALWHVCTRAALPAGDSSKACATTAGLPRYSLLVPLFREAESAGGLVEAMAALDYPTDRLEVFFITESDDAETRSALESAGLAAHMRILTVPDGTPRTKPRALNFALTFASGDYVGIYDAEDIPDPLQLRKAVAAFRNGGPDLACVQAHLNIYNPGKNFLTRQFTLEYTALFDCILPALDCLKLPLPLGGTSNHFDRRLLEAAGAWDPFNVTEDADLGVRFSRLGMRVAMIDSTTWEEAPETFAGWFGQRSRWIKGWMQTYIVHMRAPLRAARDFGTRPFFGFHAVFGGLILSTLVHPWFYALLIEQVWQGTLLAAPTEGWNGALWWFCCFNVLAGYATSIALVAVAVARRGGRLLIRSALGLPIYWLAISLAAYGALIDIVRRPHHWIKTAHVGSGRANVQSLIKSPPKGPPKK